MAKRIDLVIVGPSAAIINGSLLRAYNVWRTVKRLSSVRVKYLPITYPIEVLLNLRSIIEGDIIIISGVSPWISSLILLIGKLFGKCILIDVHGSPYYEYVMSNRVELFRKMLLYLNEYISYKLSRNIIVASRGLVNILYTYFKVKPNNKKNIFILPNSVSYLFMDIMKLLKNTDRRRLWDFFIKSKLKVINDEVIVLIAPLPEVFIGNLMAYEELMRMVGDLRNTNIKIVITGIGRGIRYINSSIINAGYLPYIEYALLLLNSRAMILPYPDNAVCGGVRNKVLEAGYCSVPLISTKNGVLHLDAKEWVHYIPLEEIKLSDFLVNMDTRRVKAISENMRDLVFERYLPSMFSYNLLNILRMVLRMYRNRDRKL